VTGLAAIGCTAVGLPVLLTVAFVLSYRRFVRSFHRRNPDEVTVSCGTCGRTYTYQGANQTAAATRLHDELYCVPARDRKGTS
jgi:hypothetical protein